MIQKESFLSLGAALSILLLCFTVTSCSAGTPSSDEIYEFSVDTTLDMLAAALSVVRKDIMGGFNADDIAKIEMDAATLSLDRPRIYTFKINYKMQKGTLKIIIGQGESASHELTIQSDIEDLILGVEEPIESLTLF